MTRGRITSLDGLRGLAAAVVVIHHALLVSPALAGAYGGTQPASGWAWWLSYTPLHLLWNGPAAVYIFFVLSGYVLARPGRDTDRMHWAGYYPKRLIRLYLPVAAATALAMVLILLVPRPGGTSWWVASHGSPGMYSIANDLFLLARPGASNSVLWSLRWEVWFSLLLPLLLIIGRCLARLPLPLIWIALSVLSAAGAHTGHAAVVYLPMFGCGVALAFAPLPRSRLSRRAAVAWGLAALCGVNSTWLAPTIRGAHDVAFVIEVLSACSLVALALYAGGRSPILTGKAPTWLGSRSYSLYLVHEPLIVTVAVLAGTSALPAVIAVAVPGAFLLAELFYRLVERPSIRAAGWAGAKVDLKVNREPVHLDTVAALSTNIALPNSTPVPRQDRPIDLGENMIREAGRVSPGGPPQRRRP